MKIILTKSKKIPANVGQLKTVQNIYTVEGKNFKVVGRVILGGYRWGTVTITKQWKLSANPHNVEWDFIKSNRCVFSYEVTLEGANEQSESFFVEGFWMNHPILIDSLPCDFHEYEGHSSAKQARATMMKWIENRVNGGAQ